MICFSFLKSAYWTCCFVLSHSGSSLQFHKLWTLYLWWKCLSGFPEFFLLIHLLCIVTLLMSLSIVTVSVLLPQICWILLLDFLSSHLLLLLAILHSILTSLDLFSGLLFSPVAVIFFLSTLCSSSKKVWNLVSISCIFSSCRFSDGFVGSKLS